MKKLAIAASSVALAAMPVVGVFADTTTQTDTIDVTISPTCTMSSVSHAGSTGTWTTDTLATTIAANDSATMGSTTFTIICNNKTGWQVSSVASALTGKTTTTENIPVGTVSAGTAAWSYTPSTSDSDITAGAVNTSPVASSSVTTGNDGKQFTVTYAASTDTTLSAQTYEGTIAYTLATKN